MINQTKNSFVGECFDIFNLCYCCTLPAHLPQLFWFYRPNMMKDMQRRNCITVHFLIICSSGLGY